MSKSLMGTNHTQSLEEKNLDLFDRKNPRSLWCMIPEYLQELVDQLPESFMIMTEHEMRKKLKPDRTTDLIRMAFWMEYERAQRSGDMMRIASVYSAVCSKQLWTTNIIKDPRKLAYIMCPPADYMVAMNEILMHGTRVLRDIMTATDVVGPTGKLNAKNAEVVLKAFQHAHVIVHGAPVIRTKSENVSLNLNQTQAIPTTPKTVDDLKAELANLQRQAKQVELGPSQHGVMEVVEEIKDAVKIEGETK